MSDAGWKRRDLLRVAGAVAATPLSGAWLREARADSSGTLTVAEAWLEFADSQVRKARTT